MQQQEPPPSREADIPASERRVMFQELFRALAAIEPQKQEHARRWEKGGGSSPETPPLGQMMEALGLNSTPEEIWTAVRVLRSQARSPLPDLEVKILPPSQKNARSADRSWKMLGLLVPACLVLASAVWLLNSAKRPPTPNLWIQPFTSQPSRAVYSGAGLFAVSDPDAEFYRRLNLSQGPHPQYRIVLHSPFPEPGPENNAASADLKKYAINAIPDGYTFYRPHWAYAFLGGNLDGWGCVIEDASAQTAAQDWMMTRYNGRYYIHCWILGREVTRLKQGHELFLRPSPINLPGSFPGTAVPLTLAIGDNPGECVIPSGKDFIQPSFQAFQTVHDSMVAMLLPEGKKVTLDAHAWENFPAFQPPEYRPPAWSQATGILAATQANHFQTPGFDASSQVETLQTVPSGHPIHCSGFTLQQLFSADADQRTISQVLVDARPHMGLPWQVIKIDGRAYLRGWIAERPHLSSLAGRGLAIFSSPEAPEFVNPPVQITVPFDSLEEHEMISAAMQASNSNVRVAVVIVSNIHLDKYAWENW